MAEHKSYSSQKSVPDTDATPSTPGVEASPPIGGPDGVGDRRNHPQGAFPRTLQGANFSQGLDSGFPDSGNIPGSSDEGTSKLYPSGYKPQSPDTSWNHDVKWAKEDTRKGSADEEELIARYLDKLPDDKLKVGYYDVMIIYCEEDREKAAAYRDHLKDDIKLKSGKNIKAILFDGEDLESLAGSKFQHLEEAFERCTFAFVYLTKEFCESEDGWCRVSSEECLMKAIYDKDKKWCVVPVYTVSRNKASFKIPMGLNALKGVNFYNNDEFYRRGLTRLLEDKLYVREKKEEQLRSARVLEIQKYILDENERKFHQELRRQESENDLKLQEERHKEERHKMELLRKHREYEIKKEEERDMAMSHFDQSSFGVGKVHSQSPMFPLDSQKMCHPQSQPSTGLHGSSSDYSLSSHKGATEHDSLSSYQGGSKHASMSYQSGTEHSMEDRISSCPSGLENLRDQVEGLGLSQQPPSKDGPPSTIHTSGNVPDISLLHSRSLEPDRGGYRSVLGSQTGVVHQDKYQDSHSKDAQFHSLPPEARQYKSSLPDQFPVYREIHHHYHYETESGGSKSQPVSTTYKIVGAKNVQIGEHGKILNVKGGHVEEEQDSGDEKSGKSSGSEDECPKTRSQESHSQSLPSADVGPPSDDNTSTSNLDGSFRDKSYSAVLSESPVEDRHHRQNSKFDNMMETESNQTQSKIIDDEPVRQEATCGPGRESESAQRSHGTTCSFNPVTVSVSPKTAGISTKTAGVSPVTAGVSPVTAGVSPKTAGINPKTAGISTKTAGVSPVTAGVSPVISGISSKPADSSPGIAQVGSQKAHMSPNVDKSNLSLSSLLSEKAEEMSAPLQQKDTGTKRKIKPFETKLPPNLLNFHSANRPVGSVRPIPQTAKTDSHKPEDQFLQEMLQSSHDRNLDDNQMNENENNGGDTFENIKCGENSLKEKTDVKLTTTNSEETRVKEVYSSVSSEETEVKQLYSEGKNVSNIPLSGSDQGHETKVKSRHVNVMSIQKESNVSDDHRFQNIVAPHVKQNIDPNDHRLQNVVVPQVRQGDVDPDETEVLKPVNNRVSSDLDIDGGNLDSISSDNDIGADFTILAAYSDRLTEVDKEVQAVQKVLEMGFEEKMVKKALNRLQSDHPGRRHFSIPDLLEVLLALESADETSKYDTGGETVSRSDVRSCSSEPTGTCLVSSRDIADSDSSIPKLKKSSTDPAVSGKSSQKSFTESSSSSGKDKCVIS